jgi:hypothetical protein
VHCRRLTLFFGASSGTLVGRTVGGDGEFALTSNLTFKAEILYVDLGIPKETAVAQTTLRARQTIAESGLA